jgi:preprotein translocase subunit YajC
MNNMNGAITMFILVMVMAVVGVTYFEIQERREAKRIRAKREAKKLKKHGMRVIIEMS